MFIAAATKYSGIGLTFAAVDCVKYRDICNEHQIKSYPTIRGVGFGEEVEKELTKKDVHSISDVETFVKKYQNNFQSPQLRGHVDTSSNVVSNPVVVEKPFFSPPLEYDRDYKPEDHVIRPDDACWINK